jgi:predicted Fe-S protein YdhL (DUF1289 family)
MKTVKTPCIGICSTVFGDEVCRGCKRFVHEVIDWNTYSSDQKILVKERLERFSEQVLSGKVIVSDKALFKASLKTAEVSEESSEAMEILGLLRKASKQISKLAEHGLKALPEYGQYSASELKELIEAEIHLLSTATYRKNFKRAQASATEAGSQKTGTHKTSEGSASSLGPETLFNDAINESEVQI